MNKKYILTYVKVIKEDEKFLEKYKNKIGCLCDLKNTQIGKNLVVSYSSIEKNGFFIGDIICDIKEYDNYLIIETKSKIYRFDNVF